MVQSLQLNQAWTFSCVKSVSTSVSHPLIRQTAQCTVVALWFDVTICPPLVHMLLFDFSILAARHSMPDQLKHWLVSVYLERPPWWKANTHFVLKYSVLWWLFVCLAHWTTGRQHFHKESGCDTVTMLFRRYQTAIFGGDCVKRAVYVCLLTTAVIRMPWKRRPQSGIYGNPIPLPASKLCMAI